MKCLESSNLPALYIKEYENLFKNAEDLFYKTKFFESSEIVESILYSYLEVVHVHEITNWSTRQAPSTSRYEYVFISNGEKHFLSVSKSKLNKEQIDFMVNETRLELLKEEMGIE